MNTPTKLGVYALGLAVAFGAALGVGTAIGQGHPGDGTTPAGPDMRFATEVPSGGTYRLYLDFQHGGVVRTAELTVTAVGTAPVGSSGVPAAAVTSTPSAPPGSGGTAATATSTGRSTSRQQGGIR